MEPNPGPLLVIVGPTASGKSELALQLARKHDGEIIAADSRTIYSGMDIGTAKPSKAERAEIPHHMLDIVSPDQPFTAADFKLQATQHINDCHARSKLPILVGGTGLYIDGVIFDFAFLPPVPPEEREQLQAMSVEELQQKIRDLGLRMPENAQNPRHLVRTIETNGAVAVKKDMRANSLVLGVEVSKPELSDRIVRRVDDMLAQGLEVEVKSLVEAYGWSAPGLSAVGYREWQEYLQGVGSLKIVRDRIIADSMQYAKRQRTWFRRNEHIGWVKTGSEAEELVQTFLQRK